MERPNTTTLRIGDWCVNPASGQISREGETVRLETRAMRLLACLAERAGEVVSIDELLDRVWPDVTVSSDSVYQVVASLRRKLGDDPKQPTYIETVPRLGYRMVATVRPWTEAASAPEDASQVHINGSAATIGETAAMWRRFRARFVWLAAAAVCTGMIAAYLVYGRLGKNVSSGANAATAAQPAKSIAVLPFLDLTEHMAAEEFADGMTEELIDKLSRIPGLQVTPPTSSFYYKGKQIPVAEIAKALGVAYVLDGSVRKSGTSVRIAARLTRADTGYVVWSETYDHPFDDVVMVQDDIAGAVTKALRASIEGGGTSDSAPLP